jgi:ribonuclease HI
VVVGSLAPVFAGSERLAPKGVRVKATLFADGGSRGNPGPAASGAVLYAEDGSDLAEVGAYLGVATNNVAEWHALEIGLRRARELGVDEIAIRMDSELVVRQVTGVYRVKHADLIPFWTRVRVLLREFKAFDIRHVPRAQNTAADAVCNQVLDAVAAGSWAGMPT